MKILICITVLFLFKFCYSIVDVSTICSRGNECSCLIANLTTENDMYYTCLSPYICPYDPNITASYDNATKGFCSGHGDCNFTSLECSCEEGWGGDGCNIEYTKYELSNLVKYGLIVIGTVVTFFCCSLHAWLHKYRSIGDVKAMSITFTHLSLLGCTLVSIHSIIIGTGYTDARCVLLEWFAFAGITLLIGCTLLKAYRIANIFGNQSFSPSDLTDKVLLKYLAMVIALTIFLLSLYTALNYVEGGAYYRFLDNKTIKEYRCSSKPLTMICYSLLIAWQLFLLLLVLRYGNQTRGASKLFKETKCIYVGSNIGALIFITFGVFILFTTNYTLQISIRGFGSLLVIIILLYLLFSPKFNAVYGKKDNVDADGMTEKDRALSTQYEANLKDRSGKELLLVLTSLINELSDRAAHKMLSIELNDRDIEKCAQLLHQIHQLVPKRTLNQINSTSLLNRHVSVSSQSGKGSPLPNSNVDQKTPSAIEMQSSTSNDLKQRLNNKNKSKIKIENEETETEQNNIDNSKQHM